MRKQERWGKLETVRRHHVAASSPAAGGPRSRFAVPPNSAGGASFLHPSPLLGRRPGGAMAAPQRRGSSRRWLPARLLCLGAFIAAAYGACGPPPSLNNTLRNEDPTKDSYEIGSTLLYVCDEHNGYVQSPGKPNTITCLDDSTWSEIQEFCVRSCKLPPSLLSGELQEIFINRNVFPVGTNVTYKCRPGHVVIRKMPRTITCLETLQWTEIEEFCSLMDCGNPGELHNGDAQFQFGKEGQIETTFGSTVTFVCNRGFRTVGRNTRLCTSAGWNNAVPHCDPVFCSKPPDIINGTHTFMGQEEFDYQTGITYSCDSKDISLIGAASIHCTENGNWSGPPPKCKVISCTSPHIPNSRRTSGFGVSHTFKDSVGFACKAGFALNGSSLIECGEDNQWHPQVPVCQLVTCGSPPEIADGTHNGTVPFAYGTSVTYRCKSEEFNLIGKSSIRCGIDGFWSEQIPTCKAVHVLFKCEMPSIAHGEVITLPGFSNENKITVEIRCAGVFVIHGESRIHCIGEKQWHTSFPECHLSQGFVAGIIILVLILILVIVVCLYWYNKKKQGHYPTNEKGGSNVEALQLKNSDHAVDA